MLVEAGARPVWMPTVRYMPLPETGTVESSNCVSCVASLDVALLELASFDVVAFASRNAVYGFLERMKTLYGSVESAVRIISEARVKLACLPPVASLLRDKLCSLADRIIPSDEGASDLSDVLASTGSGAAVLCVAPVFEDFEEPKPLTQTMSKLSFAGMDITRVPAYRVRAGDSKLFKQELEWLTRSACSPLPTLPTLPARLRGSARTSERANTRECADACASTPVNLCTCHLWALTPKDENTAVK